jgi:hypothetical protein
MPRVNYKIQIARQVLKRDRSSGCWLWNRSINSSGYGQLEGEFVHRVAYVMANGSIPKGLEVDHKCGVRNCFNPSHLQLLTHKENMAKRGDHNKSIRGDA